MKMPKALSEEAVAKMLWDAQRPDADRIEWGRLDRVSKDGWLRMARAVLAWAEAKARDCVAMVRHEGLSSDEVIARVFGRKEES